MADISLTIRLDLQNTDVQNVLNKLDGTFKTLGSGANQVKVSVDNLGNSLTNVKSPASILDDTFAKIGLRMQGFINLFQAVSRTFGDFIRESNAAEEAAASLTQALQQQGNYSESTINDLKNYASELQNLTGIDDDLTIKTMAQLTAMGMQGDQLKQATSLAQDLAAVMGTDMSAAARVMADAFNGNVGMLGRYIKGLDEQDIKQRGMISIIEQLTKAVGGQAEAMGNTGAGAFRKFTAALNNLKQSFGDLVKDILTPLISLFTGWIKYINDSSAALKALALGVVSFATVFALINTSMGSLPFVIGIVITSATALVGALKNGEPIIAGVAAAIGALTIALVAMNAKLILTSSIIATTIIPALTALKAAIISNPWLLLAAAVIGAGVALYSFFSSQNKVNTEIRDGAKAAEEARLEFDKLQTITNKQLEVKLSDAQEQLMLFKFKLAEARAEYIRLNSVPTVSGKMMLPPEKDVANATAELSGLIDAQQNYINKIESTIAANNKAASSSENVAKLQLELDKLRTQAMSEGRDKRIAEINNEFEVEKNKLEERKDLNDNQRQQLLNGLESVRKAKLKSVDADILKKEKEQNDEALKNHAQYLDTKRELDIQYQLALASDEDQKTVIQRSHLENRIADLRSFGVLSLDQQTELQRNELALLQLTNDESLRLHNNRLSAAARLRELEINSISDANEREIAEINEKYEKEIELAGRNTKLRMALEGELDDKIRDIRNRQQIEALEANNFYKTLQAGLISSFQTGWNSIIDASMTGAEKWKAVWTSMKQAAWNVIGSVVQKFIEGKLAELFITKTVEAGKTAATVTGEATRTATTQTGVLARIASMGMEVVASLTSAGASIVTAIANAVRWVFTTIPFPFSLAVAGGAVAAIGAMFSGVKSAFGFEQGGVFKKGQRGFIEGTKTEIIQPEEDFISYLNKKIIPTIVNTTRIITMQQPVPAFAGSGSDALLREVKELKMVLKRKEFSPVYTNMLEEQKLIRKNISKAQNYKQKILR